MVLVIADQKKYNYSIGQVLMTIPGVVLHLHNVSPIHLRDG